MILFLCWSIGLLFVLPFTVTLFCLFWILGGIEKFLFKKHQPNIMWGIADFMIILTKRYFQSII